MQLAPGWASSFGLVAEAEDSDEMALWVDLYSSRLRPL